jgi:hypothetical protein
MLHLKLINNQLHCSTNQYGLFFLDSTLMMPLEGKKHAERTTYTKKGKIKEENTEYKLLWLTLYISR